MEFPSMSAATIFACFFRLSRFMASPNLRAYRPLTEEERKEVADHTIEFEKTLQEEAKHLYVLCVEDQRLLSAYVLAEKIENTFPPKTWERLSKEAKREVEESGKCLSLERYTGSGFHVLRALESVVREYIIGVTGAPPKKRDLGYYLDTLRDNGADPKCISVLDGIRNLHRNPLMHPEDFLNQDEAIGLFQISQTALVSLIADMDKRGYAGV